MTAIQSTKFLGRYPGQAVMAPAPWDYAYAGNHDHAINTKEILEAYEVPKEAKDMLFGYTRSEWYFVAEVMVLWHHVEHTKLTDFQEFVIKRAIEDVRMEYCKECGLPEGSWCGKSYFILWIAMILTRSRSLQQRRLNEP